jgi:hypothetical protein
VDGKPTVDPQRGGARELPDIYAGESAESAFRSLDGGEHGQRRDLVALRAALDTALANVTPTLPLVTADAYALFDLMRQHAPSPLIRDVMLVDGAILVRVYDGRVQIYERRLEAH